jgi:dihydrolipoamide dehydrogenase
VDTSDRGFVKVDPKLQTNVPHVWAVGGVAPTPPPRAHGSVSQGMGGADRIGGIEVVDIDYVNIPKVTYCSPEMASVGLTEAAAREQGREIVTEKLDFRAIGKADIVGEGGFVKLVAEADGGPVLGVHMIGPHVTDLISEAMLITNWEAVPAEVAALIHPHPTLSEGLGEAHLALAGRPLHTA